MHQTSRGEIVIGGGSDPYPLYGTRSTLELKEGLIGSAVEMFPFMSEMRLMRQWAGITDMTSDYSPIMGLSPVENYYLDAGWGAEASRRPRSAASPWRSWWHPAARYPISIAPFSLDRFDAFRQVNEMGATAASH